MSIIGNYRPLTNEEFLVLIDHKRNHSPIINELCLRLEETLNIEPPAPKLEDITALFDTHP